MGLKLPPHGFKFTPSDKQLLEDFLRPKIQGTLRWDIIKDKEIYGPDANPWEIFSDSSTQWITSGSEKSVYVFSHLTKIADKESSGTGGNEHYVRKAGCGTWHVETGRKIIVDGNNNHIGEKRMLVFQINDVKGLTEGDRKYWKMHEYFLKGYEDYVVCQITSDVSKRAKVYTKDVSGTKSKANKKIAATRTTKSKDEKGNQGCHEEKTEMMSYQNLLAPMNSLCLGGSDQAAIIYQGMPVQYNGAGGVNSSVEEQEAEAQGLEVLHDHQRLNNQEAAQPVIPSTGGGIENLGSNGGSHDEAYLDLEDLFGGDFWPNVDNLLMDDPMSNDNVPLNFEGLFDAAGSWSDKNLEEPGQVSNNVQEQQQQQQQQQQQAATRMNMSCMLGKRPSFEAQEAGPIKKSRI
ncbi:NAC domain-containing protein 55-like [Daucus carota subsp. sativus]|uniref:NAC domain-containing protein 55-like n=1 Tax=Daucus carota subsp. sativus TaxID=79200 RepID=UPI0007EF457C|nr:PREDICTED: NAC domain-containing protein 55-like [Daucus carota subsp. sativus]